MAENQPRQPKVSFVRKAIKGDTYTVLADSALEPEDEFSNLYWSQTASQNVVLMPPYEPKQLCHLITHNNVLNQCIEAMEVNIDGTGYDFVPAEGLDEGDIDEAEQKLLEGFFNEPVPGKSFLQIRRKTRRDLESTGYAYIEVLRNLADEVVGFRSTDSHSIRFVKLDAAVPVKKTVTRNGKEVELTLFERERRFVQVFAGSVQRLHYYREFGTTRHCNRRTGEWETKEKPIPVEDRATELISLNINPDVRSPYGVPRWINQMPSAIGSRKAEEANLEFFDAGGMPPAIIFVQGGTLAGSAADQLNNYLSGKMKHKNRAVVVEAQSSSGTLDSAGTVQVRVERFGSERANDAMYQNYDKSTEEHIRIGFRLPPLFIGRSQDYSFATAIISYMVAEEQVFQPERAEFDSIINKTLVKALGVKTVILKSRPVSLKTIENRIQALQLIAEKVEGQDLVDEVNKLADTNLTYKEPVVPPALAPFAGVDQQNGQPTDKPVDVNAKPVGDVATPDKKPDQPFTGEQVDKPQAIRRVKMLKLAHDWGVVQGFVVAKRELSPEEAAEVQSQVESLKTEEQAEFLEAASAFAYGRNDKDFVSLVGACCGHKAVS